MNKSAILKTLTLVFLSPSLAAAQAVYPAAANNAEVYDHGLKIAGAAAALGGPAAYSPAFYKASEPAPADGNSMPVGQKWGYLGVAYHTICAQLADAGLLPWANAAASFDAISDAALAAVKGSRYEARKAGQASLLADEGYLREMEAATGAKFSAGGAAELLVDGPAAFAAKDRLMREAKKSIYIMSYAIYDDITGNETLNILLAKKKEGVEIKVMVDNKMAYAFGGRLLRKMKEAGIGVVRYVEAGRPHNYLHIKMLLVDGKCAIIGGMNYGDPYSHKGKGLKWRDTDILYTGPAVTESGRIFAEFWNASVKTAAERVAAPAGTEFSGGPARIAVLPHKPPTLKPAILISVLKAMYGATRRVNIENSYVVAIPALTQAIFDARARGVEVNVFTNSRESIDSDGKPMADVILKSARLFAASGANIYLKQGQTLHSKFLTVDGIFCNIGSYNLHPRSERYDLELNISLLDPAAVEKIDAVFARDIAEAKKVTLADLDRQKPGWFSGLVERFFFSQLSPGK